MCASKPNANGREPPPCARQRASSRLKFIRARARVCESGSPPLDDSRDDDDGGGGGAFSSAFITRHRRACWLAPTTTTTTPTPISGQKHKNVRTRGVRSRHCGRRGARCRGCRTSEHARRRRRRRRRRGRRRRRSMAGVCSGGSLRLLVASTTRVTATCAGRRSRLAARLPLGCRRRRHQKARRSKREP